eukprot:CAMPEP_0182448064 /NCGR_PEP_ID=MMETSP1172-20130603/23151_1 /TAXON_ID=708627 /ORGANISM="Timspurckia oligopyrenoides, Strain CCMP3278" /LENGTH=361 /DNA_ID=CAMNT_0024644785 /DNA_START=285 /DNA_END=1370 /DNA_ORIENTATION=-
MTTKLVKAPCESIELLFGTESDSKPCDPSASDSSVGDMTSSDYYFNSYAHFGIHEQMLKDEVRTVSYMRAICDNAHLFSGKVVLDVGCGTGVLSMFAARAGAKVVYAVEMSRIVDQAREIVQKNGFDGVVEIIEGKMEEVELPSKVDIIISEWMGYFLFYESMLESVVFARDKWLKPGGLIFPDKCTLFLCAIEDAQYRAGKIDFWDDVYGLKMDCIKKIALSEPLVDIVYGEQVCTAVQPVIEVDVNTVKSEDLTFAVPFRLQQTRTDFAHAIVAFFDVRFTHCHRPIVFDTGPFSKPTHWNHTVFYLDKTLALEAGELIQGTLACRPNKRNPRDLDIAISYYVDAKNIKTNSVLRYWLR